jgi:hypothetical protein
MQLDIKEVDPPIGEPTPEFMPLHVTFIVESIEDLNLLYGKFNYTYSATRGYQNSTLPAQETKAGDKLNETIWGALHKRLPK